MNGKRSKNRNFDPIADLAKQIDGVEPDARERRRKAKAILDLTDRQAHGEMNMETLVETAKTILMGTKTQD